MRVIIESPFAGDVERNKAYALQCLADSLARGEAPIAFHLLYPEVLDDLNAAERKIGIERSFEWQQVAEVIAVYVDHGITAGMQQAIGMAQERGLTVIKRRLSA